MAGAAFSINEFRSRILNGGLARTNRFEVLIPLPDGLSFQQSNNSRLVSLLVEQASFPMLNIGTKPFRTYGVPDQRPVSTEFGGEGVSMTFHVDRDMNVKKFFETWMSSIVSPDTYNVSYKTYSSGGTSRRTYATDILVRQYDEATNIRHEIKIIDAFPRNMNLMDLNHSSSNQTHRLNVLFAYKKWVDVRRQATETQPVPRVVTAPQVPTVDARAQTPGYSWNATDGTAGQYGNFEGGSSLPPAA